MTTFDAAQLILDNSVGLILNRRRRTLDDRDMQTLYNSASNDQVCPPLVNGDHIGSRTRSMNDFVHTEVEVRNLGLRFQVMAGMGL